MKKSFVKFLVLAGMLGLAACGGANADLQVFNASPDAPPVDILIDNQVVVSDLPPFSFSQYQEVSAGNQNLRVNETGSSRTLVELNPQLTENQNYTLIVLNLLNDIEALLLTDDNSIDQPTTAKIRLVNGSPSSPGLDFYFTAPGADISSINPLLSDLTFKEVSNYLVIGAGTYEVRATQTGTKTVLIDSGNFVLSPSQVRTGVTVDSTGGGGPFNIVFLPDKI